MMLAYCNSVHPSGSHLFAVTLFYEYWALCMQNLACCRVLLCIAAVALRGEVLWLNGLGVDHMMHS